MTVVASLVFQYTLKKYLKLGT